MSLLNLLSVGNSFSDVKDFRNRYRMTRDNLLPQFGSQMAWAELAQTDEGGERDEAVEPLASQSEMPIPNPSVQTEMKGARKRRQWLGKRMAVFERKPEVVPVQRDLPWENIPVARNELLDTDLEVVRQSAIRESVQSDQTTTTPRRNPLITRLVTRFLGAGKP